MIEEGYNKRLPTLTCEIDLQGDKEMYRVMNLSNFFKMQELYVVKTVLISTYRIKYINKRTCSSTWQVRVSIYKRLLTCSLSVYRYF